VVVAADWSHEIALVAEPQSVGAARDFIGVHLLDHDLSHLIDDIRLVVSELTTNALAHAETAFVVTLSSRGGSTHVQVRDRSTSPVSPRTPGMLDTGGRGLLIVEALSQAWGSTTDELGSKCVWASFAAEA
jgi:anti-sigma regulatory factor (Ser/Thr protein kinase)